MKHSPSDIEKAIAAAKAQGLTRYRIVKEGRKIIVEVSERDEHNDDAIDAEEAMKKAVGS